MINEITDKLINGYNADNIEIKESFDEILSGLAGEVCASALITALKAKGETIEETTSAIISSREAIQNINLAFDCENLLENTTLEDEPEDIFDVSLGCDIISSANGLGVYKYFSPFESNLKSLNTLRFIGIDFEGEFSSKNIYEKLDKFEKCGFIYLKLSSHEAYFKYTSNILRSLKFKNILNTVNKFLNPLKAKNQMIGLNNKDDVEKIANICLNLNNSNSIVLSAGNNFPYISLENETYVAEAWKNKIFTYILTPELVQVKPCSNNELKCENVEHRFNSLIEVIKNKQKNQFYDFLVINSALCLYIAKKAPSIADGINLAKKTIEQNLAYEKFEQIKKYF